MSGQGVLAVTLTYDLLQLGVLVALLLEGVQSLIELGLQGGDLILRLVGGRSRGAVSDGASLSGVVRGILLGVIVVVRQEILDALGAISISTRGGRVREITDHIDLVVIARVEALIGRVQRVLADL
jgi:hypothetical protein